MNILIVTSGYNPVPAVDGGAVQMLVDTITDTNEEECAATFEVVSVSNGKDIDVSRYEYASYHFINNTMIGYKASRALRYVLNGQRFYYFGNAYIHEVEKIIRKSSDTYDAIVVENNPQYVLRLRRLFRDTPIFLHLHNDYLNSRTKLAQTIMKSVDGVFAVSNYIAGRVKTIGQYAGKVHTLYNGIDIARFSKRLSAKQRNVLRKKYGVSEKDFTFLYTGRIMPEKGVLEMIEAFQNANSHKNMKLLIAGCSSFKGAKDTRYARRVKKMISQDASIIPTGYVDYDKIPQLYQIADAQIIPSVWQEPLATTIIEGMAAGLPQIINDTGGSRELADGTDAIFTDPDNLIRDLEDAIIQVSGRAKQSKSRIKAEKFTRERFFADYIRLLANGGKYA